MNIYLIVIISLYAMSMGMNLAKNGTPREGNYTFLGSVFTTAIMLTLIILAINH